MTMTQKKWLEIPLLLLTLWFLQALELSILNFSHHIGTPQVVSLIVAYLAYSRGWKTCTVLTFVFSFLGAANVGYATGVFVAAHVWAALLTKSIVSAFTLEGRPAFVILAMTFNLLLKSLTWTLLKFIGASPTLPLFFAQLFLQTLLIAILAWLLFPIFNYWDSFFDHAQDEDKGRTSATYLK